MPSSRGRRCLEGVAQQAEGGLQLPACNVLAQLLRGPACTSKTLGQVLSSTAMTRPSASAAASIALLWLQVCFVASAGCEGSGDSAGRCRQGLVACLG